MARQSLGTLTNNFAATTAPTVNEDIGDGYDIGSRWIDVSADKAYVCLDNSSGAAVWTEVTAGAAGGIGNVVEDLTPQLGGNLDMQTHLIEGVDATEMGYLVGVTSAIQTQLDAKQASDATLTSIAALGTAADKLAYTTGIDTWAETALTAFARSILDDANEAAFKATVNLEIGTDVLAQQTIGIANDNLLEVDGTPNAAEYARFTANGLEGRTEAEFKADFNLEIGTDVQAYDANLPTWPATVDATEVGYLNGVTSAIQTQLDALLEKDGSGEMTGDLVFAEAADHSSTPGAGKGYVWVKNTTPSTLIFTNDAGTDTTLGTGGTVDTSGTPVANDFARFTDADTIEGRSYAEVRADLSLEVGTDVQAYDAELAALAGLTSAANKLPYFTGSGTAAVTDLTAFARSILDDADEATFKATVNLEIGTDVLAQQTIGIADNNLVEIDSATAASGEIARFTANGLESRSNAEMKTQLGYLTDVVDDTTPQLGGALDCNGQNITDAQRILFDATPDADHTATGNSTDTINAGATITAFTCLYLGSGGKWLIADASATGTADKFLSIALEAGTDTNPIDVALPGAFIRDDTWTWTVGGAIYLSETAGALTQTAPTTTDAVVRVLGYAISADVMYFMPETGVVHA